MVDIDPGPGWSDPTEPHFKAHDLGATMRRGVVEPKLFGNGLLYPGRLYSLAGPPESGKSVMSLYFALQVMQMGYPVLVVDEEAGPAQTAAVLLALGATAELVDKFLFYLPYPCCRWGPEDLAGLDQLMRTVQPKLSIWDSSAALMATAGIEENDNGGITRFWGTILSPVARQHRCTVLAIDHVGKDDHGSRYARGGGAKLAGVDVQLKLHAIKPFSRHQDGLLELKVSKDRAGWLHRDWRIRVRHDPLSLEFSKTEGDAESVAGDGNSMPQRILMSVLSAEPAELKELNERIFDAYGHHLTYATMKPELNALLLAGYADRIDQGGGYPLWTRAGVKPGPSEPQPEPEPGPDAMTIGESPLWDADPEDP